MNEQKDEQKVARAAEECLEMMDASDAPLVAETDYISRIQADDRWSNEEIKEVQVWVRAARPPE